MPARCSEVVLMTASRAAVPILVGTQMGVTMTGWVGVGSYKVLIKQMLMLATYQKCPYIYGLIMILVNLLFLS